MKQIKQVICGLLIAAILSVTIVSDYSSAFTVCAEDENEDDEFIVALIQASAALGGLVISTGPGLMLDAVLGIKSCYDLGYSIGEHLIYNDNGTVTIPAGVIQNTLDAMNLYDKVKGFSDADIHNLDSSVNNVYMINALKHWCVPSSSICLDVSYSGSVQSGGYFCANYNDSKGDVAFWPGVPACLEVYAVESGKYMGKEHFGTYQYTSALSLASQQCGTGESGGLFVSGSFPIFSNREDALEYFYNGTGYKDALNYHEYIPTISYSSNYSPNYSGGDVVVSRDRLVNLPNKYPDVIDDPDDTVNYVFNYLTDDEEPIPPGSDDEVPNPSGSDDEKSFVDLSPLTDILEKIYKKLCEILESMEYGFEELLDSLNFGFDGLKQKFDEVLGSLSYGFSELLYSIDSGFADVIKYLRAISPVFPDIKIGDDNDGGWDNFFLKLLDNVFDGIATLVSGLASVGETAKTKFPFSIPWDILFIISFLADTPQAPYFEFPIEVSSLGISELVVIDFKQFEPVSKITRLMLTMLYFLALMKLTDSIISIKKDN